MKKLQQLFASIVLTLVLSASTFAGDGVILPWVTPPPPSSTSITTASTTTETDGVITTWPVTADPVTEVALSMLQTVLALF